MKNCLRIFHIYVKVLKIYSRLNINYFQINKSPAQFRRLTLKPPIYINRRKKVRVPSSLLRCRKLSPGSSTKIRSRDQKISDGRQQSRHNPHEEVHDQPSPQPQAIRKFSLEKNWEMKTSDLFFLLLCISHLNRSDHWRSASWKSECLQGGSEGKAGHNLLSQGYQHHFLFPVQDALWWRQIVWIWSDLWQRRQCQEVRAEVQAH